MSDDEAQGRRGTVAVRAKLGRAKLAEMAGAAKDALTALRKDSQATRRRTATGKKACEISVCLKVVTPILGGGPKLRDVDRVDSIRVPTVRATCASGGGRCMGICMTHRRSSTRPRVPWGAVRRTTTAAGGARWRFESMWIAPPFLNQTRAGYRLVVLKVMACGLRESRLQTAGRREPSSV